MYLKESRDERQIFDWRVFFQHHVLQELLYDGEEEQDDDWEEAWP